ncbi:MAG: Crp/Fnr family transcriptional regulator [Anaerolineaceae bacterium]|nr:Crp/Fnr family transcriptional regulator [Anaerolineaceae bacterium]
MKELALLFDQNPVFAALSEEKKILVKKTAISKRFVKGELIAVDGDIWPYMFLITNGSIHASKSSVEGRNLVVTTFNEGDIFWGLAFFYETMPMPVSLEVAENTSIMLWSAECLIPILKSEGAAAWELSRLMVYKMIRASEILEEMTFQPVAGRLAKLLMETVRDQENGPVTRSLTLDEMAARIGSTREMVCRFLHRFADDGIIDITRTEFRVMDSTRLAKVASNSKG